MGLPRMELLEAIYFTGTGGAGIEIISEENTSGYCVHTC